jgi:DNA repair exonuclease SbcCD ATPase subunit
VKIRGTCQMCGRDFLAGEVLSSGGHCPSCGRPFSIHYNAVLAEALEQTEWAASSLENALERIAGMDPAFELDEEATLAGIRAHLEHLRRADKPRPVLS